MPGAVGGIRRAQVRQRGGRGDAGRGQVEGVDVRRPVVGQFRLRQQGPDPLDEGYPFFAGDGVRDISPTPP